MRLPSLLVTILLFSVASSVSMPQPWTRVLSVQDPPLHGNDVLILQYLIQRSPFVSTNLTKDGIYGAQTSAAVQAFQIGERLNVSSLGVFDAVTANTLLALHTCDGYRDQGGPLPSGYKYKVYVPVFSNRSIETTASLLDASGNVLRRFRVRTRGQLASDGFPINQVVQFSASGETPTGLSTFDLQTPEPDPVSYGPYPVNRAVQGLRGNAQFIISNIRDGILLHTGEWNGWAPPNDMPDSHGCIHAHPEDIKAIWQILIGLGVEARPNTLGKLPYPYIPQGLLSVEQIDC